VTAPPDVHPFSYQRRCGPGAGGTGFGVSSAVRGAGHRLPSCVGVRPIRPANSLVLAALIEKILVDSSIRGLLDCDKNGAAI
jgi:hypothetical protein